MIQRIIPESEISRKHINFKSCFVTMTALIWTSKKFTTYPLNSKNVIETVDGFHKCAVVFV